MTANKEDLTLNRVLAGLSIVAIILAAIAWLFAVSAKADTALELGKENTAKIEKKADRDATQKQLERIFDELQSMNNYLRDKK